MSEDEDEAVASEDAGHAFKFLSWNVQKRVERALERQITAVAGLRRAEDECPDVIALQEVSRTTVDRWREALRELGLVHCIDSLDRLPEERTSLCLLASKWPLERMAASEFEAPFPEKVLSAVASLPYQAIEVHVAHLPAGVTWPEQKQLTNEAIYKRLARPSLRPRILCGDFNAPVAETAEGQLITQPAKPGERGWDPRWDAAARGPLESLREYDLVDVFRDCHGYGVQAKTYVDSKAAEDVVCRYDHLFASRKLEPWACDYHHEWREWQQPEDGGKRFRLSDHSAIYATFEVGPPPIERGRRRRGRRKAEAESAV